MPLTLAASLSVPVSAGELQISSTPTTGGNIYSATLSNGPELVHAASVFVAGPAAGSAGVFTPVAALTVPSAGDLDVFTIPVIGGLLIATVMQSGGRKAAVSLSTTVGATQPTILVAAANAADGSTGAPVGNAPQHYGFLAGYAHRPAWNVAGVDYPVGIPQGKTLIDWQTMTAGAYPGLTLNLATSFVRFDAVAVVLDGIDFSLHGGAYFYFAGCTSVTFRNCLFGGTSYTTLSNGIINTDAVSANLSVKNCVFDGAGAGSGSCLISWPGSGTVTLQYNWFKHFPQQVIEIINSASLDYRFNLIEGGGYQAGAHLNSLQWSSGTATAPLVAYNTVLQTVTVPGAGEAFQFYMNSSGTMNAPTCSNNTMVATTTTPGNKAISYFLHGHTAGTGPTTLTGTATVTNNYFDTSAAYGAFYAGSFPGWTASGNTDMITGATLVPA